MPSRWVTLFLLFITPSFCVWGAAAESREQSAAASSLRQDLIDLQRELVNALERGDAEYAGKAVSDDFIAIETNGGTSDKSDMVRDLHPSSQSKPAAILYQFKVLQLNDSCAVVTYNAVFPDQQLERYQHMSDTWVKEGKDWKLKFQQTTLNLWSAHDLD